jgi:hypothetical protein
MSQDYKRGWQDAKEDCAKVCDKLADRARGIWESYVAKCRENPDNIGPGSQSWHQYYEACADAIRALAPREVAAPDCGHTFDGKKIRPCPICAAPAEVAEGAKRPSWDKIISDLRDVVSKLPAAPSLSREEWGMLYRLLDKEIPPGVKTAELEPWIALRAKVREAAKSHP